MKRIHLLLVGLLIAFGVSLQAVQSTINVGSSANDGTGDTLRSAMQKVNSNFTELYGTIFSFNGNQFGTSSSTNVYIKSGAPLTNSVLYGSSSGNWTVGSTGNLTADTARTVTTTTGALTLASGSSHIIATPTSNFGIGTTGPDRKLDVLDAGGSAQFRTTYTDGSVYTDYQTLSGGSTLISDSSGRMLNSTVVNNTSVSSRARQGGLAFDGVTAAAYAATVGATGVGDFSERVVLLVPTTTPTGNTHIGSISAAASAASISNGDFLYRFTSNSGAVLDIQWQDTGIAHRYTYDLVGNFGGKVVDLLLVKSGSTVTLYANGVAVTLATVSSTGTLANFSGTATSHRIGNSAVAGGSAFAVYGTQLFNRALTASEVVDLANKGVGEADKWASLTAVYDSQRAGGFDTGVDSFLGNGYSALDGNVDGIGGKDNNLMFTSDATTGQHRMYRSVGAVAGKRYRLNYSYYMPVTTNTTAKQFILYDAGLAQIDSVTAPANSTWTPRSVEFTSLNGGTLQWYLATSGSAISFTGTSGDLLYLRGITVTQIGCLLDPDLAVGVGYQAPDRSSNKYHGVISSSGVSHVIDQRRGQIRYTTTGSTTGAFQLLSGTAIPSNALIQSIVAWSAGTPLIYVGTATGTSNVVGHTTLTGSTYTPLTLSTQFSTTGNLWINKSATNEVNLTVNYMVVDP